MVALLSSQHANTTALLLVPGGWRSDRASHVECIFTCQAVCLTLSQSSGVDSDTWIFPPARPILHSFLGLPCNGSQHTLRLVSDNVEVAAMPLKPTEVQIARLTAAYGRHRPWIQRGLTATFIFYAISSTYNGLFSNSASSARGGKGKGKARASEGDGKRPPRVAVCFFCFARNLT